MSTPTSSFLISSVHLDAPGIPFAEVICAQQKAKETHPMISEKTKKNLETRYNCHISINYLCGTYDVFSLDGCHWDWAGTYRGLVSMLAEDKESLKRIADRRR